MRKYLILLISICLYHPVNAQDEEWQGLECTSIVAGRLATADGSVITSHTCDGQSHTWVNYVPAADHRKGETTPIRKNWRKTRFVTDTAGVQFIMEIPQVSHTFAYLNTGYPSLNEKQLGIGETTFTGPDTLVNQDSPLLIEELCRLALERCSTAREAVILMGALAEKYGYGDGGECLTVADPHQAWFFEITGIGKHRKGAAWVAQRVPDDAIAVSANIPRIGKINRRDSDNFLASANVEEVARKNGLWDGKGEFVYWKAYNSSYGNGRNFREREYRVLNHFAPSAGLTYEDSEMPFSVRPDTLVDVRDVMAILRDTYEGTRFDMCQNVMLEIPARDTVPAHKVISPVANPWLTTTMRNTLNTIAPGTVEFSSTLAVAWCSYSTVIQLRGWLPDGIGGICWYGVDNPAQSPRIPLFCGGSSLPEAFFNCGQKQYVPDCVLWQFRRANKLATLAWQETKGEFTENVLEMEDAVFQALPSLETSYLNSPDSDKASVLDTFTSYHYAKCASRWDELESKYWLKFGRGF